MAEQVGINTEFLKSEEFQPFRDWAHNVHTKIGDVWPPNQIVPSVECKVDENVLSLAKTFLDVVGLLDQGLNQLIRTDGEDVDGLARLADLQEGDATDLSQKMNDGFGGH